MDARAHPRTPTGRALVLGANGFLGSHVVRALLDDGRSVRAMVRASSDTRSIDGLEVERVQGDVLDAASLAQAMRGCETVYHSVVDTRAWLRDPAPLRRVNVDGLRLSMDAALEAGVKRFVFTSTLGTIGLNPTGVATEVDAFNWADDAPAYILTRVEAETLFFQYCREKGLPGVACCVANTFGANDFAPTPHGKLLYDAARGLVPVSWPGRFAI
ncbi:MAG: NAD-dependent epimerase/dehydratase family protein, partial [Myxococcales bacterium]|nr:NAD-dependent epimerase/dehydratase family protein [Myxococcales bacterium]